jgi:hypothetical protein
MSGDSSYSHLSCVNEYCVGPDGSKIAVNETKRYWSDIDPGTCEYNSTDLLCYPDGTLDWWSYWYPYPSCPANPGTCSVDGLTMQDGETQRFFESTDPCTPAFLTCNGADGNVTGGTVGKTYTQNNSCVVDTSCHSPDGITTPDGGIRTFFETNTPPCVSVNRQCVNGTFSPSTPTETSCGTSINAIGRFYASPAVIKKGGTTTLYGTAVAATGGCTISGVNINPGGPNTEVKEVLAASESTTGTTNLSATTGPLTASQKYKLTCTDDTGTQSKYASVIVDLTIKER